MRRNVSVSSLSKDDSAELIVEIGDPTDDLAVATVLMIVGGNLVLLRPNKVNNIFCPPPDSSVDCYADR